MKRTQLSMTRREFLDLSSRSLSLLAVSPAVLSFTGCLVSDTDAEGVKSFQKSSDCSLDGELNSNKENWASFMSFNIRFDKPSNPVPSMFNEWENRKEHIVSLINFYTPDFLGLQEDQMHQVEYFENELEEYDWIASGGKNDGKESGEFCSIHYNTNRFELVKGIANTIWLSQTPDRPSTSWDGASPRILNYGKFKDKKSGKEFYVFNTHFDHAGQTAREESAKLILQKTKEISDNIPYIVMGDFNATEGNLVYKILTRGKPLRDAFYTSENPHVGPLFTREGWKVMSDSRKRRIDYIFVSDGVCVINHAILTTFRKGNYLSDHLPVYTDILI